MSNGIQLSTNFDLKSAIPLDDRIVVANVSDLNNIDNRYNGLIAYVTSNQNLYVFHGNNVWEKIVTNNVDSRTVSFNSPGSFQIQSSDNGLIIFVDNGAHLVTGITQGTFEDGFNTTIVQLGTALVTISGGTVGSIRNKIGATKTSGQFAIASLIKIRNGPDFLLYGDVIT